MPPHSQRRFWRLVRIYFRRFRITVWLIVLALVGALAYLNQVGLPGFAKGPILRALRERGIDLQFTRLRVRFYRGIVAENVRFGSATEPRGPQLTAAEVEVQLNHQALMRAHLEPDSLILKQARLAWPLSRTNEPLRALLIDNIRTELRLLPGDQWALDDLAATLNGVKVQLSGSVSNASAVRNWKWFQAKGGPTQPTPDSLSRFAYVLDRLRFAPNTEVHMDLRGDALDLNSFHVRLLLNAPRAETPWGVVNSAQFVGRLLAATHELPVRAEIGLKAVDAQTPWGTITNVQLNSLIRLMGTGDRADCELTLSAASALTRWAAAGKTVLKARWVHALDDPIPVSGDASVRCNQAKTEWGTADAVELQAQLLPRNTNVHVRPNPAWGFWTNLAPYALAWECSLERLRMPKLEAGSLRATGRWQAPECTCSSLELNIDQRILRARAELNVNSRSLHASLSSAIDPHKIERLLSEPLQRWLEQFSWSTPPAVGGDIFVTLPAWTNRKPDWHNEVEPTLRLDGQFNIDAGGAFRGVPVEAASGHFCYSNMYWRVTELAVTRPEGRLQAAHEADNRSANFYWKVAGSMDVTALMPLLESDQRRALQLFAFSEPPFVDAEIRGNFRNPQRLSIRADLAATNFIFRGQWVGGAQSSIQYSNRIVRVRNPRVQRGAETLSADGVTVDIAAHRLFLTNGVSTMEPSVVATAIGPDVVEALEPYQFDSPPTVRASGSVPLNGQGKPRMHFDIEGDQFQWLRLNLDHVSAALDWTGDRLTVDDVRADCYGGTASGSTALQFSAANPTRFQFDVNVQDIQLKSLVSDVVEGTNNLEGILNGSLLVNSAVADQLGSWQGNGNVNLKDGLIWDFPVFGVLSPVLNGISPGLGNSRASAASGNFIITNGVIRSENLEIHSSGMRLAYRGTVDLTGQLNARVEAELLRDVWGVGPIVSTLFWPVTKVLEYKLTGTVSEPKAEPLYLIPKLMLFPFHPFRTIKQLFPENQAPKDQAPPPSKPQ